MSSEVAARGLVTLDGSAIVPLQSLVRKRCPVLFIMQCIATGGMNGGGVPRIWGGRGVEKRCVRWVERLFLRSFVQAWKCLSGTKCGMWVLYGQREKMEIFSLPKSGLFCLLFAPFS